MLRLTHRHFQLSEQSKKKFAQPKDGTVTEYQRRRFMQLVRHRPLLAAGMIHDPQFEYIFRDPSMRHILMMLLAELRRLAQTFEKLVASLLNRPAVAN